MSETDVDTSLKCKLRKRQKNEPYVIHPNDMKNILQTGRKMDLVYFQTIHDMTQLPVYFTPETSTSIADPMVTHLVLEYVF